MLGGRNKGGKNQDNCNSIIKYNLKKELFTYDKHLNLHCIECSPSQACPPSESVSKNEQLFPFLIKETRSKIPGAALSVQMGIYRIGLK